MKRALLLSLVLFVFTMTSLVSAQSSVEPQKDASQQNTYANSSKNDDQNINKQEQDNKVREKQERDKRVSKKRVVEKQESDKQVREKEIRDKQVRDKEGREKQERDRKLHYEKDRQHEKYRPQRPPADNRWQNGHHDWSHQKYQHENWRRVEHPTPRHIPFRWHDHRDHHSVYHLEAIRDHDWEDRFPGLHPFRWRDRDDGGFWYHGHHIVNGIMFYNDYDELVSIGFIHNGVFIMLRDDNDEYENHDTFFLSWWNNNFRFVIGAGD